MTTDTNSILKDIEVNTNLSRFKIEEIRVLMVQQNYLLSLQNEQLIKAKYIMFKVEKMIQKN